VRKNQLDTLEGGVIQLTAHTGRLDRLCEETKGAASVRTRAVVKRDLILSGNICNE